MKSGIQFFFFMLIAKVLVAQNDRDHFLDPVPYLKQELMNWNEHDRILIDFGRLNMYLYLLNPEDQLDSFQGWSWVSHPQIGILEKRSFFEYDSEGQLRVQNIFVWDGNQWNNSDRFSYTYDLAGHVSTFTIQVWNGTAWDNKEQVNYIFDEKGNQINVLDQNWNGLLWINSTLETYVYDDQDNKLTWVTSIWTGSNWQNNTQRTCMYDADQHLTQQIIRYWVSTWNDKSQIYYSYDASGNLIEEYGQKYVFGDWHNEYKHIFEYDDQHNIIVFLQLHAGSDTFWEKHHRTLFSYDVANNLVSELGQYNLKDAWFDEERNIYRYDDRQNRISAVLQDKNGGWEYVDSTHYYYTLATAVKDPIKDKSEISIFPNPATTHITIPIKENTNQIITLDIISSTGSIVKHLKLNARQISQIDVSQLMPGLYQVVVKEGKNTEIKNFIKQ